MSRRKRPPKKRSRSLLKSSSPSSTLSMYWQPFLRYLETECGLAENTLDSYGRDLKDFLEWFKAFGPKDILQIDLQCLTSYIQQLNERGLKASSTSRHLVSVKMFFRYLVLEEVIKESAAELLNSPKLWQYLPQVLSPDKVDELLNEPNHQNDHYPIRDRAILSMMYATGCRTSELCDFRLRDFNIEERYCRCHGKGNKERIVTLNPLAIERITTYLESTRLKKEIPGNADYLFLSRSGVQLTRMSIWRLVHKYAKRIGCAKKVSPHTLRHSFATHMLAGGAEIRALQEMLGHASIRTTQIYTHVEHSRLKAIHTKHHPRG